MDFIDFISIKIAKYDYHHSDPSRDGYSNLSFYFPNATIGSKLKQHQSTLLVTNYNMYISQIKYCTQCQEVTVVNEYLSNILVFIMYVVLYSAIRYFQHLVRKCKFLFHYFQCNHNECCPNFGSIRNMQTIEYCD